MVTFGGIFSSIYIEGINYMRLEEQMINPGFLKRKTKAILDFCSDYIGYLNFLIKPYRLIKIRKLLKAEEVNRRKIIKEEVLKKR